MRFKFARFAAGAVVALSLFSTAGMAQASSLTSQQISAIIDLLRSFGADQSVIANVQGSLNGQATAGTNPSCVNLSYNLYSGSTDAKTKGDVTRLQKFLGVSTTGYFGPLTEQAVQDWQSSHNIISSGSPDTNGYGYVGTKTRSVMGCAGMNYPIPTSIKTETGWFTSGASSTSVTPTSSTAGIQITAPNGGEQWSEGVLNTVTWAPYQYNPDLNPAKDVSAYLEKKNADGTFSTLGKVQESGKASIHWITGELNSASQFQNMAPAGGGYYVRVVNNVTGSWDRSDAPFTLLPKPVDLKINGSDGPVTANAGVPLTVSWTAVGATTCRLDNAYDVPNPSVYPVPDFQNLPASGSRTIYIPQQSNWYVSIGCKLQNGTTLLYDTVVVNGGIAEAKLKVTSPNGGEVIDPSKPLDIQFNYAGIKSFSAALYKNDQWKFWIAKDNLLSGANNTGYLSWQTPSNTISSLGQGDNAGDIFKIYITGQKADGTGYVDDKSDTPFGFVAPNLPTPPSSCTPLSPQSQTLSCPSGQTGSITQTRTSSCPIGVTSAAWSEWQTTASTCVTQPVQPFTTLDYSAPGKLVDSTDNGYGFGYGPSIIKVDDMWHMYFCSSGTSNTDWDHVRHAISQDLIHWSAPDTVLKTSDPVNERSTCDPSAVFFNAGDGDFYYLFYSGSKKDVQTVNFVARSQNPSGPFSKFTERGTWEVNALDPKIIQYPFHATPDTAPLYGLGQPSVVVKNAQLYMWFTDNTNYWPTNRDAHIYLSTSTDAVHWSAPGLTNVDSVSVDVKYDISNNVFVMFSQEGHHAADAHTVARESRDGITWGASHAITLPAAVPYSNNIGVSGGMRGELLNGIMLVAYGAPWDLVNKSSWAAWDIYGQLLRRDGAKQLPPFPPSASTKLVRAESNDVLPGWNAEHVIDGNSASVYSSVPFTTENADRTVNLAAWFANGPQSVSSIVLTARMGNEGNGVQKSLAFPKKYKLFLRSPDNSTWVLLGNYTSQPDVSGTVTISLDTPRQTYGVLMVPSVLGVDNYGNHYFQLQEMQLQ